jgi:hypothetical protein
MSTKKTYSSHFFLRPLTLLVLAALAASVMAVVVLAIGFPSIRFASGEPSKAGSQTPTAQDKRAPAVARDDAPKTTAIKVSAIHEPFYAKASDGKVHLEYDLVSTSVFPLPVTLTKVVVSADDGRELLTLEGDALQARTQPLGDLTHKAAGTREVPSSGSVATLMDVEVPPGKVPESITNRITYALPADTPKALKALIGGLTTEGPNLDVPPRPATVITPPLSGEGWWNGNGCCLTTGHRSHRLAVDGQRYVTPETFAIDFEQVRGTRVFEGDGTRNGQYFAFGAKVSSVANGKVVFVRDGLPEQTPGTDPLGMERALDFGGNQVVVRIGGGVYAQYYHLQTGSIDVREGEHVHTGQLLGKLGNTGNSFAPHLHFELSSGPNVFTSDSLPYVFDSYTWAGEADLQKSTDTDLFIKGKPRAERKSYPLYPSLADFR